MKITSVEAVPFRIPYRHPVRFASGEVTAAEDVLVRLHTDQGLVGVAEAPARPYTYGETQTSIVAAVTGPLAAAVVGLDPFAREQVRARMLRTVGNACAKGALDLALWDIVGQAVAQPVSRLLGGWTDRLQVAHMVGLGPTPQMVDEAVRVREVYGVTTFKIKVGRTPVSQDLEACQAIRETLGPEAVLYVDANRGWDADQALRVAAELVDLGVTLLEEPCPNDDTLGRRRLVARSPIPVVGDESCTRLPEVARNLLDGMCSAVSIKTARTGFTESARIVGLCEGLGVPAVLGSQVDGQLGTLAAVAFGAAFPLTAARPAELSSWQAMTDDLLAEPLTISDGVMLVRDAPGLGALLDPDKVERYRIDR